MMSRSDWENSYLRNKHLSLTLLTAITAEGKNKWLKSSILPAGIKRWCCIRHFETQSNHTSFWGRTVPLRAHSEALDNSEIDFLSFTFKPEVRSKKEMFVITKWTNQVLFCLGYLVYIKKKKCIQMYFKNLKKCDILKMRKKSTLVERSSVLCF